MVLAATGKRDDVFNLVLQAGPRGDYVTLVVDRVDAAALFRSKLGHGAVLPRSPFGVVEVHDLRVCLLVQSARFSEVVLSVVCSPTFGVLFSPLCV